MRYRIGLQLRALADRIDGGLHAAFVAADRDEAIYTALRMQEERSHRDTAPKIVLRCADPEATAAWINDLNRRVSANVQAILGGR